MKDTIQNIIPKTVEVSNAGIELINNVDQFYNSAWDKLVLVGTVSFAVVGIIVPLIIQWYQKKTLKISEELLKNDIENQVLKVKTEIIESINQILEDKIKKFESKIDELNASMSAKAFHLQGNGQLNNNLYREALADYIISAKNYFICNDYTNLQNILLVMLENCIPKLSVEEIEDLRVTHNCNLDKLLETISEKDTNGTFTQNVRKIKYTVSKLPKNIKDKTK